MFSLPALSRRFVEDFAVPESFGFRLDIDLGVGTDRINRRVADFNVLSTQAIPLYVMHLRVQHNIYSCNTFRTKCVATHLVRETLRGD